MIVRMAPGRRAWRCTRAARHVIEDAARRAYPDEGCGWLLGPASGEVRIAVAAGNEEESGRAAARYLMGPDSYRAVSRMARAEGLDVVGVFHSHPDHPPLPSATDLAEAWPSWLYVIVPVQAGTPGDLHGWLLRDDRSGFMPIELDHLDR